MSKQEDIIEQFLKENQIKYKPQYIFDDCIFKGKLRFDFAIFHSDGNLKCLIEYDGIRHYKCIDNNHDAFNAGLWRDKTKTDYCNKRGIPLLRIPYVLKKESAIHRILTHHLIKNHPIVTNDIECDLTDDLNNEYYSRDIFDDYHIDNIIEFYLNGTWEDILDEYYSDEEDEMDDCDDIIPFPYEPVTKCQTKLIVNGVEKNLKEWCEIYKINYKTVQSRIRLGWELNEELFKPTRIRRRNIG